MLGKRCRGRHNNKLNIQLCPGLMLVHRLHCLPNIKLTLSRCSFCGKYSVYSVIYYEIMLCTHRVDYYNEAIPLEYKHTCLAIVNSIFGLAKLLKNQNLSVLIHCSPYRICWDAPKSMHTLEVDICILKTCLEVIICRAIKCL